MLKREALFRRVVFVLCAGFVCAVAALPGGAGASCGEGTAPCVRFKAGKEIRKGTCETFECGSAGSGSGFGARFPDEGGGGWSRSGPGMYSWYKCSDDKEDKANCAGDGDYLDGNPATMQEKPVMGKGWLCYEKNGADEVMCVKDAMSPDV